MTCRAIPTSRAAPPRSTRFRSSAAIRCPIHWPAQLRVVTAVDEGGNTYVHTHSYTGQEVRGSLQHGQSGASTAASGDPSGGLLVDSSGNGKNGETRTTRTRPVGISGDGDHARDFFGKGGYGYVNNVAALRFQSTLEAPGPPAGHRDQSIVGHGDAGETLHSGRPVLASTAAWTPQSPHRYRSRSVPAAGRRHRDGVDIRIYVNGVETGKTRIDQAPSSVSTFYVGSGELAPWFTA